MVRGGSAEVKGGSSGSGGQGPTGPTLRELARAPRNRPTHRRALGADKAIREEAGCKVRLVIGEEMNWGKGGEGCRGGVRALRANVECLIYKRNRCST